MSVPAHGEHSAGGRNAPELCTPPRRLGSLLPVEWAPVGASADRLAECGNQLTATHCPLLAHKYKYAQESAVQSVPVQVLALLPTTHGSGDAGVVKVAAPSPNAQERKRRNQR